MIFLLSLPPLYRRLVLLHLHSLVFSVDIIVDICILRHERLMWLLCIVGMVPLWG